MLELVTQYRLFCLEVVEDGSSVSALFANGKWARVCEDLTQTTRTTSGEAPSN